MDPPTTPSRRSRRRRKPATYTRESLDPLGGLLSDDEGDEMSRGLGDSDEDADLEIMDDELDEPVAARRLSSTPRRPSHSNHNPGAWQEVEADFSDDEDFVLDENELRDSAEEESVSGDSDESAYSENGTKSRRPKRNYVSEDWKSHGTRGASLSFYQQARRGCFEARDLGNVINFGPLRDLREYLTGSDKDAIKSMQMLKERWIGDTVLPRKKDDNVLRLSYSPFYPDDHRKRDEEEGWQWLDLDYIKRQTICYLGEFEGQKYLPSPDLRTSCLMGPFGNQKKYSLKFGCSLDLAEPWKDGQTAASGGGNPGAPDRRDGWIFNVGGRVKTMDWAPNRGKDAQVLAVGLCPTLDAANSSIGGEGQNPYPVPPTPESIQFWAFPTSGAIGKAGCMAFNLPPKLFHVVCTDWGELRQLKWCPVPKKPSPTNLGLLATVWGDGYVRILDIEREVEFHTARSYVKILQPLVTLTIPNAVPSCVTWLSQTHLAVGHTNGILAVHSIHPSQLTAPILIHPLHKTCILAMVSAWPSHPQYLACLSASGLMSLIDWGNPNNNPGYNPNESGYSAPWNPGPRPFTVAEITPKKGSKKAVKGSDDEDDDPVDRISMSVRPNRDVMPLSWHPNTLAWSEHTQSFVAYRPPYPIFHSEESDEESGGEADALLDAPKPSTDGLPKASWTPGRILIHPLAHIAQTTIAMNAESTALCISVGATHPFIAYSGVDGEVVTTNALRRLFNQTRQEKYGIYRARWFAHDWRPAIEKDRAQAPEPLRPTARGMREGMSRMSEGFKAIPALQRDAKYEEARGGLLTVREMEVAATHVCWNPNLECGGWAAAALGSGLIRVEDLSV